MLTDGVLGFQHNIEALRGVIERGNVGRRSILDRDEFTYLKAELDAAAQKLEAEKASAKIHLENLARELDAKKARDPEDEKHLCPLQLDVIERACVLWSNPGEVVLTPFMGVGSEVYGAIVNGRRGLGIELKPSYYRQAVKNCAAAANALEQDEIPLIARV